MLNLHGLTVLSLLSLIGCAAAYTPPPLTPDHPAHPEAMAVAETQLPATLAYQSSDIPSPQPASLMAQAEMPHGTQHGMQHGMHDPSSASQAKAQTFVGEGTVIAVVPSSNQLVVDHKAIEGLMDAMTMGYKVEPPSLLEGLNSGDTIRFTIDAQKKAIVKVEKLKK